MKRLLLPDASAFYMFVPLYSIQYYTILYSWIYRGKRMERWIQWNERNIGPCLFAKEMLQFAEQPNNCNVRYGEGEKWQWKFTRRDGNNSWQPGPKGSTYNSFCLIAFDCCPILPHDPFNMVKPGAGENLVRERMKRSLWIWDGWLKQLEREQQIERLTGVSLRDRGEMKFVASRDPSCLFYLNKWRTTKNFISTCIINISADIYINI